MKSLYFAYRYRGGGLLEPMGYLAAISTPDALASASYRWSVPQGQILVMRMGR